MNRKFPFEVIIDDVSYIITNEKPSVGDFFYSLITSNISVVKEINRIQSKVLVLSNSGTMQWIANCFKANPIINI